ncbi:MAG: hypothetical protein JWL80_416 [Parcubacteria group bacterium]|nr:hypothetical protein [Parcubacteria group bacterium]
MIGFSPQGKTALINGLAVLVRTLCEDGEEESVVINRVLGSHETVKVQTEADREEIRNDLVALLHKPRRKPKLHHPRISQGAIITRELGEVRAENRHDEAHPPLHRNAS